MSGGSQRTVGPAEPHVHAPLRHAGPGFGAPIDELYVAAPSRCARGPKTGARCSRCCPSITAPRTATSRAADPRRGDRGAHRAPPDPAGRDRPAVLRPGAPRRGHERPRHHQRGPRHLRARSRTPTGGVRALRPRRSSSRALADDQLELLVQLLSGEEVTDGQRSTRVTPSPSSEDGPQLLIGGGSIAAARRAGRFGLGLIAQAAAPGMPEAYEAACRAPATNRASSSSPTPTPRRRCSSPTTSIEAWDELGPPPPARRDDGRVVSPRRGVRRQHQHRAHRRRAARRPARYRVVTVDEAVDRVGSGAFLPLLPLCGGLPPTSPGPTWSGPPTPSPGRPHERGHVRTVPAASSSGPPAASARTPSGPIAARPDLELVGVWVHTPEKVGRDAGELAGIEPLGIAATNDADALHRARDPTASCTPRADPNGAPARCPTTSDSWRPASTSSPRPRPSSCIPPRPTRRCANVWARRRRPAGASLYASGIFPGFASDELALLLTTQSQEHPTLRVIEVSLNDHYPVADVMMDGMGFARPLDFEPFIAHAGRHPDGVAGADRAHRQGPRRRARRDPRPVRARADRPRHRGRVRHRSGGNRRRGPHDRQRDRRRPRGDRRRPRHPHGAGRRPRLAVVGQRRHLHRRASRATPTSSAGSPSGHPRATTPARRP